MDIKITNNPLSVVDKIVEKAPIRLTISQAANMLASMRNGPPSHQQWRGALYCVRGVYKINFESLLKWSQDDPSSKTNWKKTASANLSTIGK